MPQTTDDQESVEESGTTHSDITISFSSLASLPSPRPWFQQGETAPRATLGRTRESLAGGARDHHHGEEGRSRRHPRVGCVPHQFAVGKGVLSPLGQRGGQTTGGERGGAGRPPRSPGAPRRPNCSRGGSPRDRGRARGSQAGTTPNGGGAGASTMC